MITSLKAAPADAYLHFVLAAASPFQSIFDKPGLTHEFCNHQALTILRNDGFSQCADFFNNYITELNLGVYWADEGWKNIHHYFDPYSQRGLWHSTHAVEHFAMYYRLALQSAKEANIKKSVFLLGAAAHLLQDLCVPHHARAKLFHGHKQYEGWVQEHYETYAVSVKGTYFREPNTLINYNACIAADFLDWVRHEGDNGLYIKSTQVLLPLAQRTTAGLFHYFAGEIQKTLKFPQ